MDLGFATKLVYGWTTMSNQASPMFDQALRIANHFGFNIEEFLK
jgi:hypothetical protein